MTAPTLVAVLPAAWFVVVLALAVPFAPRVRRPLPEVVAPAETAVAQLGRALRTAVGRPIDPVADRRAGQVVIGGIAGSVVDLRIGAIVAVAVAIGGVLGKRRDGRRFQAAVAHELPEVIELLRLALAGGGSILVAVEAVARHQLGPVSTRLAAVGPMVQRGHRLGDQLAAVAADLGDQVRPVVRALVGSEHYGTEVGSTLTRLAGEARDRRRRSAQAEARRLPIKMLMPLVLGVLPAFILLTIVPTLAGTFRGLDLGSSPR